MANTIVLVRHGFYTKGTGELNEAGKAHALKVAKRVQEIMQKTNQSTVRVFTAPEPRCSVFAAIITQHFGEELVDCLDGLHANQIVDILLTEGPADVVVYVGHLDMISYLPVPIGKRLGCTWYQGHISEGKGFVIQTEASETQRPTYDYLFE